MTTTPSPTTAGAAAFALATNTSVASTEESAVPSPTTTGAAAFALATNTSVASTEESAVPLIGCHVTTITGVRLRESPSIISQTLVGIDTNTTLQANAVGQGWYRVIYGDLQGWIREDLVIANGNCS